MVISFTVLGLVTQCLLTLGDKRLRDVSKELPAQEAQTCNNLAGSHYKAVSSSR